MKCEQQPRMSARTRRMACLALILGLILVSLALVAFPQGSSPLGFCLVNGTVFGQISLAAAWCVLGPFSLSRRLCLAAIWLAAIILCMGWNRGAHPVNELDILLTFAVVAPCQSALVAILLSFISGWNGLRFDDGDADAGPLRQQIGIREALFLTGVTALVLGAARYHAGQLDRSKIIREEALEFACLIAANVTLAILLIAVVLVRRGWLWTVCSSLVCLTITMMQTAVTLDYFVERIRLNELLWWMIFMLTAIQTVWIIAVVRLVQLGGFVLGSHRTRQQAGAMSR